MIHRVIGLPMLACWLLSMEELRGISWWKKICLFESVSLILRWTWCSPINSSRNQCLKLCKAYNKHICRFYLILGYSSQKKQPYCSWWTVNSGWRVDMSQGRSTPWSLGMANLQPLRGNPYKGYINPYYWVDDHPLLYGNIGNLDPSTYGEYLPVIDHGCIDHFICHGR